MTFASCIFSGKIPERKDSLMIWDSGEEICGERIFNNFMGILLGPIDLPVFSTSIISAISWGAVGVINQRTLGGTHVNFIIEKVVGDISFLENPIT